MPGSKLIEGVDFYLNDAGQFVLTELYHLNRGYCCGLGCKHCPYEYQNVPPGKRDLLLKARMNNHDNPEKD